MLQGRTAPITALSVVDRFKKFGLIYTHLPPYHLTRLAEHEKVLLNDL